jgi:subtilisin family serine protease
VITVAAVGNDLKAAYFSSASAAVDLSAPGVGILTATPPQFDEDGTRDGYEAVTGTSFSAPMVAAAAAWVRAAKPGYRADQVAQVLRSPPPTCSGRAGTRPPASGCSTCCARSARPRRRSTRTSPTTTWCGSTARATGHVDSPIWRGGGPHRVRALVDKYEDPADVYRIVFPPHARVRVTVKPRFGNPTSRPSPAARPRRPTTSS